MFEGSTNSSENDTLPEGFPVQHPCYQPQSQIDAFPQQYHPEMLPPQFIQQSHPQFIGVPLQFIPTDLNQMNPAHLMAMHQAYEREIQHYHCIVPISWVLLVLNGIVMAAFIFLFVALCFIPPEERSSIRDPFNSLILVGVFALISAGLVYIYLKTISAYHNKNLKSMSRVYIWFWICLVLNVFMLNIIGMVLYGYLTYAANKLKRAFSDMKNLEDVMASKGMRISQLQVVN